MLIHLFLFSCLLLAADKPKLAEEKVPLPKTVAKEIAEKLHEKAYQIPNQWTLWPVKEIRHEATKGQLANGLTFREIPGGTLLGIVQFHEERTDYRKQTVAAGVYSLRFFLQPDVGDHAGTAPHREFAVLQRIEDDKEPDVTDGDVLQKRGLKVIDGSHVSPWLLLPAAGKAKEEASLSERDGVHVLEICLRAKGEAGEAKLYFGWVWQGVSASR